MTRDGCQSGRRRWAGAALVLAALAGCQPSPDGGEQPRPLGDAPALKGNGSSPTGPVSASAVGTVDVSDTVATLGDGVAITRGQLDQVLYESHGLTLLGDLAEVRLAEQQLAEAHLPPLTDADVAAERQRFYDKVFGDVSAADRDQYFKQLKSQGHLSDVEYALGFRKTAALRKLARRNIAGRITDKEIERAFGMLYGENRQIADIAVKDMVALGQVRRALAAPNADFGQVAAQYSRDGRTKANGGQWPPFSANTPTVPKAIMEAAFGLRVGQVTPDAISDGTELHVIKLLKVIPPKLVKFDDAKAEVRRLVEDQVEQTQIEQYQQGLKQLAVTKLNIMDPTLRQAFQALVDAQRPQGTVSPAEVGRRAHAGESAGTPKPPATAPAVAR